MTRSAPTGASDSTVLLTTGAAEGQPTEGYEPRVDLDDQYGLYQTAHSAPSPRCRRIEGCEEQDQKRQCQRTAQKQPVAKAPPVRDAAKQESGDHEAQHRSRGGQKESHGMKTHRLQSEDAVHDHAQWREREQR